MVHRDELTDPQWALIAEAQHCEKKLSFSHCGVSRRLEVDADGSECQPTLW